MSAERIYIEKNHQTSDDGDENKKKVVINSLDYDSLAKIIMLLPIPERIDMEEVCVKWKEACQLAWYDIKEYKCKSSIGRCYDNQLLTQSYLKEILLRCGNYLKELSLSDVCDSSIMSFVGDHCKNLTSLECQFDVDSLIINVDDFVQAFTQLDKLRCIKITVVHNYMNETINLSAIINSLPKEINEIHLFSNYLSTHKRKVFMTFKKFKNLQKLTVHDLWSENILREIAEMTALVHLNIRLYEIPKEFFLLKKLVNLQYIIITVCPTYEVTIFSTEIFKTIFCTCKNLKHLDIPYGPYEVAKIPIKKQINLRNLEYLSIPCNIMPDLANKIVEYCKNLKYLRIHGSHSIINETSLIKLTELENLECLILFRWAGTIRFHEESIIAISNNCKKLKRLEIHGCTIVPSVNSNSFSSSSVLDELSKLQHLEHLNLRYAESLKDSTIIAIANNCKNLKSLEIENCTGLTKTGLVALLNLENLQKLNVTFLDIITDDFLIKLKGIKELNCVGCEKLTDAGIIQFIKNNPDLEMIDVNDIENITIDIVIGADQATRNRTNGIILHIQILNLSIQRSSESIIKSQWLVVDFR